MLEEEILRDFEKHFNSTKEQTDVFETLCYNLHELEVESGISLYSFEDKETHTNITNPFMDTSGMLEVNPFEEYGVDSILKSEFSILMKKVKENIQENTSEEDRNKFICEFIKSKKKNIELEYYRRYSGIKLFEDFEIIL